ncbi:hypothetical protein SAMN02799631_06439 [Methylobacterium sp. 174MFSha1.1]|uniref:hypothetical protein n=1 Tax=Methylobacterium sp. 174MFSha1.1 TaxID=1502749 RepID=UPI0008E57212|nr:hypothetical protein [Methylobacterium sp. 174MFSha1.1]SFV16538.1 hypothetical protein SAMN02799631_06439 [Methylobacterium sp. 174MFSha1.1]
MRQNGRTRKPAETSAIGNLPGASRGYLPLLPTACVAVCLAAGSLYWREAPPRAPESHVAALQPLPGGDLFRIVPEADGRARAPYPLEFEQQFPLIAGLPAEAPMPALPVLPNPEAKETRPEKAPRRTATHRPRAVPALAVPALADLRPPVRPDDLKVRTPTAEKPAPATRTASGGAEPERTPWLPFAPTGRLVTQTMVALGDGVTNAGAAMIDLIDRRR